MNPEITTGQVIRFVPRRRTRKVTIMVIKTNRLSDLGYVWGSRITTPADGTPVHHNPDAYFIDPANPIEVIG